MKRNHYSPQEKVATLRRHFLEGVPVSELCDELRLHPTQFSGGKSSFSKRVRPHSIRITANS